MAIVRWIVKTSEGQVVFNVLEISAEKAIEVAAQELIDSGIDLSGCYAQQVALVELEAE